MKKPEEGQEEKAEMKVDIRIKEILLTIPLSEYDENKNPNVLALKSKKENSFKS